MSDPKALFSREALASWSRICKHEVLEAVHKRDSWLYEFERHVAAPGPDGLPYELLMERDDPPLRAFVTRAATSHTLIRFSLPAPLASVTHGCIGMESSEHHRAMLAHMYGDNFVDGGILQISERPTPEDPFHLVGVTFLAVKVPVLKARRFVMFEHSVFKVARSIPSQDAALAQLTPRSKQLAFGEMYVVLLLRSSHGGTRTDAVLQGMLNQGAALPLWASGRLFRTYIECMARVGTTGVSRALRDRLGAVLCESPALAAKVSSESAQQASACRVCLRKKRPLASMRVCVSCERAMCKTCTQRLHFAAPAAHKTFKLRFCRLCVADALSAGGQLDAGSTSSGSSPSNSTSTTNSVGVNE
jgi:hypothetical protein